MKTTLAVAASFAASALAAPRPNPMSFLQRRQNGTGGSVLGFDISGYQGSSVDFSSAYSGGLRFVYIKATQSTDYIDPDFSTDYQGATNAGFIRGAYHYADGTVSATDQVNYFIENGGNWSNDGITLPGALDLEGDCISVDWIQEFSDAYQQATSRYPVLYSSPSWWESCTGNSNAFVNTNPLWMACYDASPCTPQGDWPYYTIWQYNDANTYGGDSDSFNGNYAQLQALATGS